MIDKSLYEGYECGPWIEKFVPAKSGKKALKFEEGTEVVIMKKAISGMSFKSSYHPKWLWVAEGHEGIVIGRYSLPGAYVKYAIKVPSLKKVFPVHSNFLRKFTEEEKQMKALVAEFPEIEGTFRV